MRDDHEIGLVDRRDGDEVAHQLVVARRDQRLVGGLGVGDDQQRVAVGRGLGRLRRADHGACAGAVLDDERLLQAFLQVLADQPRGDVGRPAGAERNDELDDPRRIILGNRSGRRERCRKQDSGELLHDVPPRGLCFGLLFFVLARGSRAALSSRVTASADAKPTLLPASGARLTALPIASSLCASSQVTSALTCPVARPRLPCW